MSLWDSLRRLIAGADTDNEDDDDLVSEAPETDNFVVLICPFEGDHDGSLTEAIAEAVGGRAGLTVRMASGPLPTVNDQEAVSVTLATIVKKARAWAQQQGARAILWGDVVGGTVLRLRFTPVVVLGEPASGEAFSGDSLDLPIPMGTASDLALAAALATLQLGSDADRKQRLERLRTSINAVDLLLQDGGFRWPPGGKLKASILYAVMQAEVGYRTGHRPMIDRAADVLRAVLAKAKGDVLSPQQLAAAQLHLADVMSEQGYRDRNPEPLETAVKLYRAAANFYVPTGLADEHAFVMLQMGRASQRLSSLSNRSSDMKDAAQAYHVAATIWGLHERPELWAELQVGIGSMMAQLSEFSGNKDFAEKAVQFYNSAAKVWSQERDPRRWANLMNNVGAVRFAHGKRAGELPVLREAVECFHRALTVYTDLGMTKNVHVTQKNISRVQRLIAVQEGKPKG